MKDHPKTIVLASGNAGKLREFKQMLADYDWAVKAQSEFFSDNAEETGLSFVENAILKARFACERTQLPAVADDSGIEVDALRGQPGIYSARFAGPQAKDEDNNQKLLNELKDVPAEERIARYQCVLVFMQHANDPTPLIFQGSWQGLILDTPKGTNGFGYDPYFFLPELNCTAAELDKAHKNAISHRGQAMQALLAKLSY